jgi:hypothetical protein
VVWNTSAASALPSRYARVIGQTSALKRPTSLPVRGVTISRRDHCAADVRAIHRCILLPARLFTAYGQRSGARWPPACALRGPPPMLLTAFAVSLNVMTVRYLHAELIAASEVARRGAGLRAARLPV